MKIVNIDGENLHISWTTQGTSMKFSGKMWLMIILTLIWVWVLGIRFEVVVRGIFTLSPLPIPYASLQWFIPSKTSAWPQGQRAAQLQWAVQRCGSAGWFSLPQKDPSRRPPPQPAPNRSHHLGAFGHLREPTFQKANGQRFKLHNLPWLHGNP